MRSVRLTREEKLLAGRAQRFINNQPSKAGTWPGGTEVIVPGEGEMRLKISDKVGDDSPERWVEVLKGGRLAITLVYNHHTKSLVRIF